jgi:hypothetical protein
MSGLAALYFPYAAAPLRALKEAALYFDEVYCIDPESIEGTSQLPGQQESIITEQASEGQWAELQLLWQAGVCKALRPEQVRSEWNDYLTESVLKDLQDRRYVELCARSGQGSWSIAETKMGMSLVHELMDLADDVRRDLPGNIQGWIEGRTSFDGTHFREINDVKFREGRHHGEGIRYVDMPFVLAESVLVNLAMCTCASLSRDAMISPLTNESIHYAVLKAKYERSMRDQNVRDLLVAEGVIQQTKETALVHEVFRSASLPRVSELPAQKILDIRKKFKDKLDDYRVEMSSIVQQIEQQPWDTDFERAIRTIVNDRIRPNLRQLCWDIKAERDSYWLETLPQGISKEAGSNWLKTVVLAGASVPGLLLDVGRSAINLVPGWLAHKKAERGIRRNGLAYLLDINRAARWSLANG